MGVHGIVGEMDKQKQEWAKCLTNKNKEKKSCSKGKERGVEAIGPGPSEGPKGHWPSSRGGKRVKYIDSILCVWLEYKGFECDSRTQEWGRVVLCWGSLHRTSGQRSEYDDLRIQNVPRVIMEKREILNKNEGGFTCPLISLFPLCHFRLHSLSLSLTINKILHTF